MLHRKIQKQNLVAFSSFLFLNSFRTRLTWEAVGMRTVYTVWVILSAFSRFPHFFLKCLELFQERLAIPAAASTGNERNGNRRQSAFCARNRGKRENVKLLGSGTSLDPEHLAPAYFPSSLSCSALCKLETHDLFFYRASRGRLAAKEALYWLFLAGIQRAEIAAVFSVLTAFFICVQLY